MRNPRRADPLTADGPDRTEETQLDPLYRVIIHNDEVTPMDFVVHVLKVIFSLTEPDALAVMLTAHHQGQALVQILPRRAAQARIGRAHFAAGLEGYPLTFRMEPE